MTADQARLLCETMTGVIEQEAVATRTVVKAITNRDYKPDPKSRSAWELATHWRRAMCGLPTRFSRARSPGTPSRHYPRR